MTLTVTREEDLLVRATCGRSAAAVDAPEELRWERLLLAAEWHRSLPLLADHLERTDESVEVPDVVRSLLDRSVRSTMARNVVLQHELELALDALAAAGIRTVPLKGAALVGTAYRHVGLRPMSDLDLLVARSEVQRAHDVVRSLGYRVGNAGLSLGDEQYLAESHHHYPLIKGTAGVVIELHHGLLYDRPRYDGQGVLARAHERTVGSSMRWSPTAEDLFLHVVAHFVTDRIRREPCALGQLADVVRLADRGDLDWDLIVERARVNEVADRLFLGLDVAGLLAGPVCPADVLEGLRPPTYRPDLGERFVRARVLATERSLRLEEVTSGFRRFVPPRTALEKYVRPDEPVPSIARLHARRASTVTGRVVQGLARPRRLAADVRLSRWIVTLQR